MGRGRIISALTGAAVAIALVGATDLAGALPAANAVTAPRNAQPGDFRPVVAARLLDTRIGLGARLGAVPSQHTVTLTVAGHGGVPASGVSAVALNLTETAGTSTGYVTVYPAGTTRPAASTLNHVAGRSIANLVVARLGAGGAVTIYNGSSGTVQLVADVEGYYLSGSAAVGGAYAALAPARLLDTRVGIGAARAAVASRGTVALRVTGRGGVPSSGVGAVVLNVTVTSTRSSGYVTAWAAGAARPTASNLNHTAGQTIAAMVVARVGSGGVVDLYNGSYASLELVADVEGYYRSGTSRGQGLYTPLTTPYRVMDSRTGRGPLHGPLSGSGRTTLDLESQLGYLGSASAVLLNVTATDETASGHLDLLGSATSTLNYAKGEPIANLVAVPISDLEHVLIQNASSGHTHVVVDVEGSWQAPSLAWGTPVATDPLVSPLTKISCPTSTFCMGVDTAGNVTRMTGTTWGPPASVLPSATPATAYVGMSVSCPTTTFCLATNGFFGHYATYDGSSWTAPADTDVPYSIDAVSCPSAGNCVAVDSAGGVLRLTGTTWSSRISVGSTQFTGLSCPTTTFCGAVDVNGRVTEFNPVTGAAAGPATSQGEVISCPTTTFCALIGPLHGKVETFDGSTWSAGVTVDLASTLRSLSCPSATFCAATDVTGRAMTFDGTTWSSPQQVTGLTSSGQSIRLDDVACSDPAFCVAPDYRGNVYDYNGSTWSAPTLVQMDTTVTGVSCGAVTRCVEVDSAGNVVVFNGTTWAAPLAVTPGHPLSGVACVGTSFCLAVGDNQAVTYDGGSWSAPTTVTAQAELVSVSCASTTSCTALDFGGYAYDWDGAHWTPVDLRQVNASMLSISCPTTIFCALAEPYAGVRTEHAGTWSGLDDTAADAISVGCAAPAACVAGGASAGLYHFDGTRWALDETEPSAAGNVSGAACASSSFCIASFYNGVLVYFDGLDWWGPDLDGPNLGVQQRGSYVSCAGPTLCLEVGSGGGVVSAGRG